MSREIPGAQLYVFWLEDCSACNQVKNEVRQFAQENPWCTVRTVNLLETDDWPSSLEPPNGVPAFALILPGRRPVTLTGFWAKADLVSWIERNAG